MNKNKLFEELSNIEHQRWVGWQKYMHSLCIKNQDGSLTIPKESVDHWTKQINTPYQNLSEREKESDRDEVRRYWNLILEAVNEI